MNCICLVYVHPETQLAYLRCKTICDLLEMFYRMSYSSHQLKVQHIKANISLGEKFSFGSEELCNANDRVVVM